MDKWIKLAWEGMDWMVKKGYEQSIPYKVWDKVRHPDQYPECQILKKNILRTSILIPLPPNNAQTIFVKRHCRRHWKDDLRSLLIPSRAFSEWKTLSYFKQLKLPVPSPLAYGEKRKHGVLKDSCLITEALSSSQSLNHYVSRQLGSSGTNKNFMKKQAVVSQLAQWISVLHQKGIYYRDLHGGNIVCQEDSEGRLRLFFVDTGKAWFGEKITLRKRVRDLALLYNSLPSGTRTERVRFLQAYLKESHTTTPLHWKKIFQEIDRVAQALRQRHLKSRNKRCLKKSTSFMVTRKGNRKLYFRKDFSEEIIDQIMESIEKNGRIRKKDQLAKDGKTETLCLTLPQTNCYSAVCARYFQYEIMERVRSPLGYSPGKSAWFNSNGLVVRGISTPLPLALAEEKSGLGVKKSILITEDISRFDSLNKYIAKHFTQLNTRPELLRKTQFIHSLTTSLTQMYEKKVYCKNLSAKQVFVEETEGESWRFYFGNVIHVVFNRKVSLNSQVRNLMQLHSSISKEVGGKNQLQFLFHFFRTLPRAEKKEFVRRILTKVAQ